MEASTSSLVNLTRGWTELRHSLNFAARSDL
jgi:hypothetical protein